METYRKNTRRERYNIKKGSAKDYPIDIACVNFRHDVNLGFVLRASACFGARTIHAIGSVPDRKLMNELSGSLYDYVEIKQHKNPREFVKYAKNNEINLVSAELVDSATPLDRYTFSFDRHLCLVVGHEECGVPVEILKNSEHVYIPMSGVGYCLNTSQAANIMLFEATRQYEKSQRFLRQWGEEKEIYCLP